MSITNRILLFFYSLSIALISIIFLFLPLNIFSSYFELVIDFITKDWITSIIALVLFIVSIKLMLSSISFRQMSIEKSVSKKADWGRLSISYNTIEQLAYQSAKKVEGIRQISISVHNKNDEISLNIIANFMNDINIPNTIDELQTQVKNYVENISGITIKEVNIVVDEINNTLKRRVD